MTPDTRLIVTELITNPRMRVNDVGALADLAHGRHARLMVEATFAAAFHCRPAELGNHRAASACRLPRARRGRPRADEPAREVQEFVVQGARVVELASLDFATVYAARAPAGP
jgi:hypothetical protein